MLQNLIHKGMKIQRLIPIPLRIRALRHMSHHFYYSGSPASYPYEGQHFQAEGVRFLNNNNNI